jgi:hypothetical protein
VGVVGVGVVGIAAALVGVTTVLGNAAAATAVVVVVTVAGVTTGLLLLRGMFSLVSAMGLLLLVVVEVAEAGTEDE